MRCRSYLAFWERPSSRKPLKMTSNDAPVSAAIAAHRPCELLLTAAQASDIGKAEALLAGHAPEVVIADTGYDKKALVEAIEARGVEAVGVLGLDPLAKEYVGRKSG